MGITRLFIKSYGRTLKRKHPTRAAKCLKDNNYKASILHENILVFLSFEAHRFPRASLSEAVRILEQIMSEDKYSCIFSRQIEAIASILPRYD